MVRQCAEAIEDLGALGKTLEAALVDEPPLRLHEGGLIRESWNPALAELRREVREARAWIAGLEGRERERTGIASLRVRYNRVFGYGIEIPKSQVRPVPDDYVRRQTLVGAERYVTAELREQEAKVLGAEGRMNRLEYELFDELRRTVAGEADRLLRTAQAVATLDVLASLAHVARERGYVRPGRRRRGRHRHPGGPAPRARAQDRGRPVRAERPPARVGRGRVPRDHRAEHGREIDLHAAGGAHRAAGPGGELRARPERADRGGGPRVHADRRPGQPGARPEHVPGGDDGDGGHPPARDAAEPGPPRRDRPGHVDVRRPLDRLGGGRAPPRAPARARRSSSRRTTTS